MTAPIEPDNHSTSSCTSLSITVTIDSFLLAQHSAATLTKLPSS